MKYGKLTLGQIEALVNRIGGTEVVSRILAGNDVIVRTLIKLSRTEPTLRGLEEGYARVKQMGMEVSEQARTLLEQTTFLAGEEVRQFVCISLREFGVFDRDWMSLSHILEAAKRQGLKPCLPQDGLTLRVAYRSQPQEENIWLGMQPVTRRDDDPAILCLCRDKDSLSLKMSTIHGGAVWRPENSFVFRK